MHRMRTGTLVLVVLTTLATGGVAQRRPPQFDTVDIQVAVARFAGTESISFTRVQGGREHWPRLVQIPAKRNGNPAQGEIPVFRGVARRPGEQYADWVNRTFREYEKFSQQKSEAIVWQINRKFPEWAGADAATATTRNTQLTLEFTNDLGVQVKETREIAQGVVTVPMVSKRADGLPKVTLYATKTGQTGGQGAQWRGEQPSPGTMSGMGLPDPTRTWLATGIDPDGEPSIVEMGIGEIHVSTIRPTPGMNAVDILRWFETDLHSHGIPTFFDDSRQMLFLHLPDGQTFRWGYTDTGLEFQVEIYAVPEPSPLLVCLLGLGALGHKLRRKKCG